MHKTKKYKTLIQIYSSIYQQGTNSRLAHCTLQTAKRILLSAKSFCKIF